MALHGRHIGRHRERSETHKPPGETEKPTATLSVGERMVGTPHRVDSLAWRGFDDVLKTVKLGGKTKVSAAFKMNRDVKGFVFFKWRFLFFLR